MKDSSDVVYSVDELQLYKKKRQSIHYVKSLNVKSAGEELVIHTLEGDVTILADRDTYILIGAYDDIYPIPRELFERKYCEIADKDLANVKAVAKRNGIDVKRIEGCQLKKDSYVYARKMEKDFSVYTKHCDSRLFGKKGDYYAVTYEDTGNVYIIRMDIMDATYEKVDITKEKMI